MKAKFLASLATLGVLVLLAAFIAAAYFYTETWFKVITVGSILWVVFSCWNLFYGYFQKKINGRDI